MGDSSLRFPPLNTNSQLQSRLTAPPPPTDLHSDSPQLFRSGTIKRPRPAKQHQTVGSNASGRCGTVSTPAEHEASLRAGSELSGAPPASASNHTQVTSWVLQAVGRAATGGGNLRLLLSAPPLPNLE